MDEDDNVNDGPQATPRSGTDQGTETRTPSGNRTGRKKHKARKRSEESPPSSRKKQKTAQSLTGQPSDPIEIEEDDEEEEEEEEEENGVARGDATDSTNGMSSSAIVVATTAVIPTTKDSAPPTPETDSAHLPLPSSSSRQMASGERDVTLAPSNLSNFRAAAAGVVAVSENGGSSSSSSTEDRSSMKDHADGTSRESGGTSSTSGLNTTDPLQQSETTEFQQLISSEAETDEGSGQGHAFSWMFVLKRATVMYFLILGGMYAFECFVHDIPPIGSFFDVEKRATLVYCWCQGAEAEFDNATLPEHTKSPLTSSDQVPQPEELQEEEDQKIVDDDEEEEEEDPTPEIIEELVPIDKVDPAVVARLGSFLRTDFTADAYDRNANALRAALQTHKAASEVGTSDGESVAKEIKTLESVGEERRRRLTAWENALSAAEQSVNELVAATATDANKASDGTMTDPDKPVPRHLRYQCKASLQRLQGMSPAPVSLSVLDAYGIVLPGEGCEGMQQITVSQTSSATDTPDKPIQKPDEDTSTANEETKGAADPPPSERSIKKYDLEQSKQELQSLASSSANEVVSQVSHIEALERWAEKEVNKARDANDPQRETRIRNISVAADNSGDSDDNSKIPSSIQSVMAVIDEQLEIETAGDLTGAYDFASIRTGSFVIRSGPRETSRSLVDHMPLLNRAMAATNLRFYGHPAEAALTPTPSSSIGTCWAFVMEEENPVGRYKRPKIDFNDVVHVFDSVSVAVGAGSVVDDGSSKAMRTAERGALATLTVGLSRPTRIAEFVIEHPPKEISPSLESAIQDFRVYGYADSSAEGKAWDLGSFRYDIDGPSSLQRFEVSLQSSMSMRSVTLAIDSNWGGEFSCLYRFRVHGK